MSLRLDMLQAAQRAPAMLDEAFGTVHDCLWNQINDDGGFRDRSGKSDLYYTIFGMEALLALNVAPPWTSFERYLRTFGEGEALDLVHVSCLARGWSLLPPEHFELPLRERLVARLESYRSGDGGYDARAGAAQGTMYGAFLAIGALQDLGAGIIDPGRLTAAIRKLALPVGAFANDHLVPLGTTPSTAAGATLLCELDEPVEPDTAGWLQARRHPEGGFTATAQAPMPDLLSTAVALHALWRLSVPLDAWREKTLDYLDSLWSPQGGFCGSWGDETVDCEYTFYGLLVLGHLAQ